MTAFHRWPFAAVALVAGMLLAACGGDEGEPGSASSSSGTSAAAGEKKKTGDTGCAGDEECESNVCFKGNAQSFCTVKCSVETAATICVAPLTGSCNKQGFCKRD